VDPIGRVSEIKREEVEHAFRVNVLSPFDLCKLALPKLRTSKGCIIAVSSGIVSYPALALSAYCCSKAALEMLVTVLSLEEKDRATGVRVVAVRPGLVDTGMVGRLEEKVERLGRAQHEFLRDTPRAEPFMAAEQIVAVLFGCTSEQSGSIIELYYD